MELEDIIGSRFVLTNHCIDHENSTNYSSFVNRHTVCWICGLNGILEQKDLFDKAPVKEAKFTSIEFDADDTSYSPAETHSMNQLSKELATLKEKLLEREIELDSRESAISMDLESLEKQKNELKQIREDLASRLAEFEQREGQDLSEARLKEYKDTAKRWVEMGPEVASIEIQNWKEKRRFEEALTIYLSNLRQKKKLQLLPLCLNSDEDALIELADALAMRDRGLLPNLDFQDDSTVMPAN